MALPSLVALGVTRILVHAVLSPNPRARTSERILSGQSPTKMKRPCRKRCFSSRFFASYFEAPRGTIGLLRLYCSRKLLREKVSSSLPVFPRVPLRERQPSADECDRCKLTRFQPGAAFSFLRRPEDNSRKCALPSSASVINRRKKKASGTGAEAQSIHSMPILCRFKSDCLVFAPAHLPLKGARICHAKREK